MTKKRNDRWTEWLTAARDGDESAFEQLFEEAQPALWQRAMQRLSDATLADEATARTFQRVWGHVREYDPKKSNACTWLYAILGQQITDMIRQRSRRLKREVAGFEVLGPVAEGESLQLEPADEVESAPIEACEMRLLQELVQQAIAELPEARRAALLLRYFERRAGKSEGDRPDYTLPSNSEVGKALGKSAGAVATMMTHIRSRLEELLRAEDLPG